jgi:AraC-like DNA-binding protein
LHDFADDGSELLRAGVHRCEACRYIAGLRGGRDACHKSRARARELALPHDLITPFICHAGFACVLAPMRLDDAAATVTFGPFCPEEVPETIESDFLAALGKLGKHGFEKSPVLLGDIRLAPVSSVPAIAQWTVEKILASWEDEVAFAQESEGALAVEPVGRKKAPRPKVSADPYHAHAIAAALAGGKRAQAHALVNAALSEVKGGRGGLMKKRARSVALCAAVLEACEDAGVDAEKLLPDLAEVVGEIREARTEAQCCAVIMRLLSNLRRRTLKKSAAVSDDYAELNRLLLERLVEGITLNEVAERLGENPTAITHRLQRKFGMSFSEYFGRMRVDRAKELLRRTQLTVAQIAVRVGIADPSNLGKVFRKFENMSPAEYRARYASGRRNKE